MGRNLILIMRAPICGSRALVLQWADRRALRHSPLEQVLHLLLNIPVESGVHLGG